MTDANYLRHIKFLGKLAFGYDSCAANVSLLTALQATIADQVADAALSSLPEVRILSAYMAQWTNGLSSAGTMSALMIAIATALFTSADFIAGLTTTPASSAVVDVIAAWKTDFGLNSKTLTTQAGTGLINFISQMGVVTSWPAAGSPTYADGTYCVSAVV